MQDPSKSYRELRLSLTKLEKEVQAMTRQMHRQAIKKARSGDADYLVHASALIDEQIDQADARGRVICLASAAEFGLSLRHQGERCRLAAVQAGTDAIRVLYWAAVRRMRERGRGASQNEESANIAPDDTITQMGIFGADGSVSEKRGAGAALPSPALCRRCEDLTVDSRCANGHGALRPISGKFFHNFCGGALSEARAHQCSVCKTTWTRYKNKSDPFAAWSIKRK